VLFTWVGPDKLVLKFSKSFPINKIVLMENAKSILLELHNFPHTTSMKINSKGTTFFLGRSSNSQQNLN
jgi:hypothetical protein